MHQPVPVKGSWYVEADFAGTRQVIHIDGTMGLGTAIQVVLSRRPSAFCMVAPGWNPDEAAARLAQFNKRRK